MNVLTYCDGWELMMGDGGWWMQAKNTPRYR